MAAYESIYSGAGSLNPYNSNSYMKTGELGTTLDTRTANQLGETNHKLNPGVKYFEVGSVAPDVWESVPEQHLDEIKRLAELTGTKPTFHAPVIEASGIGQEGWSESKREGAEKQLQSAVLRSHKLDPKGNIPVTIHSTAQLPEMITKVKGKEEPEAFYIIDPESGQIGPIKYKEKYFPEEGEEFTGKPLEFEPEKEINRHNKDQWTENISGVNRMTAYGGEILERIQKAVDEKDDFSGKSISQISEINPEDIKTEPEKQAIRNLQREITHGQIYLKDAYRNMKVLFDKAFNSAIKENREEDVKKLQEFGSFASEQIKQEVEKNPQKFGEMIEEGLKILDEKIKTPTTFVPLQDFVIEKSAETFANVASSAYNKFGDKAPVLCIENPPAGAGLSRGEDLKIVIEKSREAMIKNLVENQGLSKSEAKNISEKMIGATWDVGHINMLRKFGYGGEDIIKETKKVAPFVKHVHLSDNFGFEHTELPMGMGNVPTKEIMKQLDKKGFKGAKIIEAGNWFQHFSERGGGHPFKPTIEAFDSPIYTTKTGSTWGEFTTGAYSMGMGPINPQVHHSVYGSGFSNLPQELGGEIPGTQSRFAGTPNQ